jgi:hypothetical protein
MLALVAALLVIVFLAFYVAAPAVARNAFPPTPGSFPYVLRVVNYIDLDNWGYYLTELDVPYLYIWSRNYSLIDVYDISGFTLVGSFNDYPEKVLSFTAEDGLAAIVTRQCVPHPPHTCWNDLRLYDVTTSPLGSVLWYNVSQSQTMFLADIEGGAIYGLTNPEEQQKKLIKFQPDQTVLFEFDLPFAQRLSVQSNYAYIVGDGSLVIVDVATEPAIITSLSVGEELRDVLVQGNLLYTVGDETVFVIDVSNVLEPAILSQLPLPGQDPFYYWDSSPLLAVDQNFLFATQLNESVFMIDVADPAAPYIAAVFTIDEVMGITAEGGRAYVGTKGGVYVIEKSLVTSRLFLPVVKH